jgi:hypothetical protein
MAEAETVTSLLTALVAVVVLAAMVKLGQVQLLVAAETVLNYLFLDRQRITLVVAEVQAKVVIAAVADLVVGLRQTEVVAALALETVDLV